MISGLCIEKRWVALGHSLSCFVAVARNKGRRSITGNWLWVASVHITVFWVAYNPVHFKLHVHLRECFYWMHFCVNLGVLGWCVTWSDVWFHVSFPTERHRVCEGAVWPSSHCQSEAVPVDSVLPAHHQWQHSLRLPCDEGQLSLSGAPGGDSRRAEKDAGCLWSGRKWWL